jgi:hypothetical protein
VIAVLCLHPKAGSASANALASHALLSDLLLHKLPAIISASEEQVVGATSQSQIVDSRLSPARIGSAVMMHLQKATR